MTNALYLGVASTCFCTYLGYKYANRYKLRRKFLAEWYQFNSILKCELAFSKNSITQILNNKQGDFYVIVKEFLFNNSLNNLSYLKKSDYELLNLYLTSLGKSDAKSQIEYVNSINEKLKAILTESEQEEKTKSVLSIKLGFIIGLTLLVLVI